MNPIDKVIFLLIPACAEASAGRKAEKPELCLSIMHLCPDIRRRGGFFQRRAEGAYFADTMPRVSEQTVPLSMELI